MPLWIPGTLADFAVGDVVAVIGGARGQQFVAGAVFRRAGGYGASITTSQRVTDGKTIRLFGQEILTDTQTRVSDCTHDPCQTTPIATFFDIASTQHYFPPILAISLESATPPLRARAIEVYWDN
jgi:hypothetical protein